MIYVPNLENYDCFVVQSEGVIRAYEEIPSRNSSINYRDYYIQSNYIYRDGIQNFGSTSNLPICIQNSEITSEVYYRNDFSDILIIFIIMSIFCFYIPFCLFKRLFRRLL